MDSISSKLQQKATGKKREHQLLFKKLRKVRSSELDSSVHVLHDKYMEKINCLECANCCRSISPAVKDTDIARLAKYLRVQPSGLIQTYFLLDDEGDYVFKSQPCPFLGEDNYCSVYDARPRACREYPHTDRPKIHQILNITYRNITICPIVYEIVEELNEEIS